MGYPGIISPEKSFPGKSALRWATGAAAGRFKHVIAMGQYYLLVNLTNGEVAAIVHLTEDVQLAEVVHHVVPR